MKIIMLLSLFILVSCSGEVPTGHVGVFVKSPYLIGSSGVDPEEASPGRHYYAPWSTTLLLYNVQPQSLTEDFDDLITKDTMPVDFSAYLQLELVSDQVSLLHEKFGPDWYKNNLERQFQEMVRNHAKRYEAFALMNKSEVSDEISRSIEKQVVEFIKSINLPVRIINVSIGKVNPPREVIQQTIETAAQEQKQKTEQQRANAELARAQAEKNKALADRAYKEAAQMNTREYLTLRALEIELAKVQMAKEKKDVTIIMGNAVPTLDVNK